MDDGTPILSYRGVICKKDTGKIDSKKLKTNKFKPVKMRIKGSVDVGLKSFLLKEDEIVTVCILFIVTKL